MGQDDKAGTKDENRGVNGHKQYDHPCQIAGSSRTAQKNR